MLHFNYGGRREMTVMNSFRRLLEIIVVAGLLAACGGGGGTTAGSNQATLTSISIAPASQSIAPGTTIQFVATGVFSNSSKQNITSSVTWTSSNATIATISSKGVAAATLEIGSTTITAASGSIFGITTLSTSTVASIAVSPDPISIAPGTMQQFTALGTLQSGDSQNLTAWANWSSSDTSIAFINPAPGLATAAPGGSGSAIISAVYAGITGTANLISSPVISIVVSPASASIAKGTTQQFTASGTLVNSAEQDLTTWATWLSSDTSVATFNTAGTKGLLTSVNTGTTVIIATYNSVISTSATLTVTQATLDSLSITPANTAIPLGKTQQFVAAGTFSDKSTQDLTAFVDWLSSAPTVASISSSGLATSLTIGTTNITASSFGKVSNIATLKVNPATLESIMVAPVSWSVVRSSNPALTRQFFATGEFTDGSLQDLTTSVTWASLNSDSVTISNIVGSQGLATVISNGTTTITATLPGVPTKNAATVTVQN